MAKDVKDEAPAVMEKPEMPEEPAGLGGSYVMEGGKRRLVERTKDTGPVKHDPKITK
jgi:hypothetical protein